MMQLDLSYSENKSGWEKFFAMEKYETMKKPQRKITNFYLFL